MPEAKTISQVIVEMGVKANEPILSHEGIQKITVSTGKTPSITLSIRDGQGLFFPALRLEQTSEESGLITMRAINPDNGAVTPVAYSRQSVMQIAGQPSPQELNPEQITYLQLNGALMANEIDQLPEYVANFNRFFTRLTKLLADQGPDFHPIGVFTQVFFSIVT